MTFEEDFPSLKGMVYDDGDESNPYIAPDDVAANCLDKSKVKQAIEKHRFNEAHIITGERSMLEGCDICRVDGSHEPTCTHDCHQLNDKELSCFQYLLKELGLKE